MPTEPAPSAPETGPRAPDRHLRELAERDGVDDVVLAGVRATVDRRWQHRATLEVTRLRRPLGRLDGTVDAPAAPVPTGAAPAPVAGRTPSTGSSGSVLAVEDVGPTVRLLRVAAPPSFRYAAGQHLKIGTAGTRRGTYSIASAPHDPHVELCVKLVPDGRLTPALFQVRPGDRLESEWRAKGSFRFDDRAGNHLMVATGAGISPLRSLLRDARHRGSNAPVLVLHGASYPDELPYHDELVALAAADPHLRYQPTVSRPNAPRSRAWSGATGRVDALAAQVLAGFDPGNTRVYACGNGEMVKAVAALASSRGFAVSTESFG